MLILHKGYWGFKITAPRHEACREDLSPGRQAVIVTPPDSPTSGNNKPKIMPVDEYLKWEKRKKLTREE